MVRSEIPFTPADQARLALWLKNRAPGDDQDWIHALEEAAEAKDVDLADVPTLPDISLTVQQLVYAQRGDDTPLPPSLDQACTELHSRWVQPDRVTLVTHYFIVRWLPELSPGLGWLILYLRSRVYLEEDLQVGQVWVRGGWSRLAASLGVSRKSLSRWITSPEAQPFFERRNDIQDPEDRRHVLLFVRLSEPIHPNEYDQYVSLLNGQDLTSPIPLEGQNLTSQLSVSGQSLTDRGEVSTETVKNLTSSGQELPKHRQNLTAPRTKLNNSGTLLNALSPLSSFTNNTLQVFPQPPVVVDWQIGTLLSRAGLQKAKIDRVLAESPTVLQSFIGWLLFGISKPSIQYPSLFAYKRLDEGVPPDVFMRLAHADAVRCFHWLAGLDDEFPDGTGEAINELRRAQAHLKLVELGALSEEMVDGIRQKDQERNPIQSDEKTDRKQQISPSGLDSGKVWQVAQGQLRTELSKTIFDTWVRDIEMVDVTGNTIILGAANEYARGWLEERLTTIVERALSKVAGESIQVGFVVSDEIER
jgi:hypothetical protein